MASSAVTIALGANARRVVLDQRFLVGDGYVHGVHAVEPPDSAADRLHAERTMHPADPELKPGNPIHPNSQLEHVRVSHGSLHPQTRWCQFVRWSLYAASSPNTFQVAGRLSWRWVAVLQDGQVVQVGSPTEIYNNPANRFVGSFIGNRPMNFLRATVDLDDGALRIEGAKLSAPAPYRRALAQRRGEEVLVGIRPEHITLHTGPLRGEVLVVEPLGAQKL